jgi:hypothetical protein
VINDVDEVLRELLTEVATAAGAGEVVFDAPTREWTTRPEDEHRLLSAVLRELLPRETLPTNDALGALRATIPLTVGVPPEQSRSIADIWSALGGELKPSLDVTVVVPFPVSPNYPVGPAVTEPLIPQLVVRK